MLASTALGQASAFAASARLYNCALPLFPYEAAAGDIGRAKHMAQYVFTMNRVGKVVPPKRVILKDISLSFFPGAKIGVLGVNGSGKSSLLRIMAGMDKDHEGDAVPMPNMHIGFLPQEPELDPKQTVRQAVEGGLGEILEAKTRLDEIYAAYAEPDADFDKLATDQAKYEAILAASGSDVEHQLEVGSHANVSGR